MVSDIPAPPDDSAKGPTAPGQALASALHRCQRLEAENDGLRRMAARLFATQETERRSIVQDLHDGAAQSLSAIVMAAHAARDEPDPARRGEDIDQMLSQAAAAAAQLRALSARLRPPPLDSLGLEAALRWYVEGARADTSCVIDLRIQPLAARPLPAREQACFRIAEEALSNALRHAGAGTVTVALQAEGDLLVLDVHDDGHGFDIAAGDGAGIASMRERARAAGGETAIASAPGRGTRIRASLPLH